MKTIEFDSAFTFIYSKRIGTPAAQMEDQIDDEIKKERLKRLMELQDSITKRKNNELVGTVQEVLVEGESKNDAQKLSGRTRTNKLVNFVGPKELIGHLADVKITESHTWCLIGEAVN